MNVALIGSYDAGCGQVLDAAVGHHVRPSSHGRVAARIGTLEVPDERLARVAELWGSERATQAALSLWDYPTNALQAGGATEAEWIGHLRTADALLAVAAVGDAFTDDVRADVASRIQTELALLDLAVVETSIERSSGRASQGPRAERAGARAHLETLQRVRERLERAATIGSDDFSDLELTDLRGYGLFAMKPTALVLNVSDDQAGSAAAALSASEDPTWTAVAGGTECELHTLAADEAEAFRTELGFSGTATARIARAILAAADLIRFYTANANAATAWLLPRGASVVTAAGTIHSDMASRFIRADVASLDALLEAGGLEEMRRAGTVRREGRDHPVADGDFLEIHFSR